MRYIFPRQFGLHNVFTSKVDHRETAMPFKDYTLREKDIHTAMCRELGPKATDAQEIAKWKQRIPKRLRGDAVKLVDKLRVRNQRCSYMEMLRHYCPIEVLFSMTCIGNSANSDREYPCQRSQIGGRAHFSRRQMYDQSQIQSIVAQKRDLLLEIPPFKKPVSQIWRVQQHTYRPFVAQSYPKLYRKDSGATSITIAPLCIGWTNS